MRWMQFNLLLQGEDGHLKAWKKSNYSVNMLSSGFLDNAKKNPQICNTPNFLLWDICSLQPIYQLHDSYVLPEFQKKEIAISKLMLIEWNCYGVSRNFNIFLNWNLNDILAMPGKKIRKEKKINVKALTVLSFQLRRL